MDIVTLVPSIKRTCLCKSTGGRYVDNTNVIYFGDDVIPIGFNNSSFLKAIRNRPEVGMGEDFTAFVLPKHTFTLKKVEKSEFFK